MASSHASYGSKVSSEFSQWWSCCQIAHQSLLHAFFFPFLIFYSLTLGTFVVFYGFNDAGSLALVNRNWHWVALLSLTSTTPSRVFEFVVKLGAHWLWGTIKKLDCYRFFLCQLCVTQHRMASVIRNWGLYIELAIEGTLGSLVVVVLDGTPYVFSSFVVCHLLATWSYGR